VRKVQLDYNELSAEEQRIKEYPTAAEIKAMAADQEAANDSVEIRFVDAEYGDAAYASRRLAPGTCLGVYYGNPVFGDQTDDSQYAVRFCQQDSPSQAGLDIRIDATNVDCFLKKLADRRVTNREEPPNCVAEYDWQTPDGAQAQFPRIVVGEQPVEAGAELTWDYGGEFRRGWLMEGSGDDTLNSSTASSADWQGGAAEAHAADLSSLIGSELDEVENASLMGGSDDSLNPSPPDLDDGSESHGDAGQQHSHCPRVGLDQVFISLL